MRKQFCNNSGRDGDNSKEAIASSGSAEFVQRSNHWLGVLETDWRVKFGVLETELLMNGCWIPIHCVS